MSIQITKDIRRKKAIDRIQNITNAVSAHNYVLIERITDEVDTGDSLQQFVDAGRTVDEEYVHKWTNRMLANQLDKEFYRFSQFENYNVID